MFSWYWPCCGEELGVGLSVNEDDESVRIARVPAARITNLAIEKRRKVDERRNDCDGGENDCG